LDAERYVKTEYNTASGGRKNNAVEKMRMLKKRMTSPTVAGNLLLMDRASISVPSRTPPPFIGLNPTILSSAANQPSNMLRMRLSSAGF